VFTIKLYQYDDIRKLNQAVGSFNRSGIPITKIEILTVVDKFQFFVLTDPKEDYLPKPKVESKTEDATKKTLKVKEEKKETTPVVSNEKSETNVKEEKSAKK
jgi:hypothetical protein